MQSGPQGSFAAQLKALREAAGFTQEELATIAGLSVHGVSALERGERRRPHVETVRALCGALDLTGAIREALLRSARAPADHHVAADELSALSLPLPLTALVGRDADVRALQQWLVEPAARLITLTGPGGAGKTRLALEIAHIVSADSAARVGFVSLATTRDPEFVASVIAETLGLSDVIAADLPTRARMACAGPTLLVLDNFEQVLDAAPLVGELLASVAALRIMVTSRAPLRVRGEREYAVGPLELQTGSEGLAPPDLARAPAVRLFLERVRDVQPEFRLTSGNGPVVAAICRRLDALPLALELAAPWMKVLTVDGLLRQLERDVLLSPVAPRDLPERQQTINATVAWSYQLLHPSEQRAFRRFGALPGRFPIEAAAAVMAAGPAASAGGDAALAATASLIDKSLLLRAKTSVAARPMYQMLETVRAYAALELAASGERDEAFEGLVSYCTGEAARAGRGLMGPAQVEWLDRVRDDIDTYRTALTGLIARGRPEEASGIAWALKYFWLIRGHAAEGLRWYEQILKLPSLPAGAESKALLGAAGMWWTQGSLERARAALDRALTLAHSVGDLETVAQAEHVSGHVEHALKNPDVARERFTLSVARFQTLALPSGIGTVLNGMAVLALATGDAVEAERLLDRATTVLRDAGPWFLTWALYVRAILAVRRGEADRAIAFVRESLTRVRELHDKFAFVYALVPLAAAAMLKGDEVWVARILGARDAVTERTGVTVSDKSVQDLQHQTERDARERLGPDRWAAAYAAGRSSSIDALLNDIDNAARRTDRAVARRQRRPAEA